MLCRLHTVYKIIHCAALHTLCDITQRVANYYTVKWQSRKNYTRQKIFTQTPSVVSVTNMRYEAATDGSRQIGERPNLPRTAADRLCGLTLTLFYAAKPNKPPQLIYPRIMLS